MKIPSKSKMIAAAVLAVGLAVGGGAAVHAATSSNTNPMSGLVNAIAQRFNLNPSDVQQVVDQQRSQMQAQRQQQFEQNLTNRVNQAVTGGKLTQAQADLILAKLKEVEAFKATLIGKTPQQRQAAMQTEIASLKQWATTNNIPVQYLMFGAGHMHGGMGWHRGMMGSTNPQ